MGGEAGERIRGYEVVRIIPKKQGEEERTSSVAAAAAANEVVLSARRRGACDPIACRLAKGEQMNHPWPKLWQSCCRCLQRSSMVAIGSAMRTTFPVHEIVARSDSARVGEQQDSQFASFGDITHDAHVH